MGYQLGVLAALAEDPSAVPSIHRRGLTTTGNSGSRDSKPYSGLGKYLHICGTPTEKGTHIHININK